jgi:hypothetical protein
MSKKLSTLEYEANIEKDSILVYYKGPFIDIELASIGKKINDIIIDDPVVNKKVFSIFIELTQNISYYSAERDHNTDKEKSFGRGTFVISQTENHYTLTSANLIKKDWAQAVVDKCNFINKLDSEDLRKLKRELRNQPLREGQLGANVGLVDIALKIGSPLDIEINPIDDKYSFFVLAIDIAKGNKN